MEDLPPVERRAVRYLRLWSDGPEAQTHVWTELSSGLEPARAKTLLKAFEQLLGLCARHGRRPLMRHDVRCPCVGADEACFARFLGAAAEGAREDAILMATLLVRPDLAPMLASLAEQVALGFSGLPDFGPKHPTPMRLH